MDVEAEVLELAQATQDEAAVRHEQELDVAEALSGESQGTWYGLPVLDEVELFSPLEDDFSELARAVREGATVSWDDLDPEDPAFAELQEVS